MFRYIAIAWDNSLPASSAAAEQFSLAWKAQAAWDAVLVRPGLHVFTTGTSVRVNEALTLQGGLGVILGKLFRRSDLGSPVATPVPLTSSEADEVLRSGGRRLVSAFWGRYVAFLQTATGTTLVLRDPSGSLPCFRLHRHGVSIVFSWLEDALQMLGEDQPFSVNWDAIAAQLSGATMAGRDTSLNGVSQVLPGEVHDLHQDRSTLLWSAVQMAKTPDHFTALEASGAEDMLRETVQACTVAWASCYETLLLRLSGGVDSSILVSCLAPQKTPADVICVNYHSPGSDSDERHYARLAAVRAGRDLLERERDPGFSVTRVIHAARMPNPLIYVGRMNAHTDAAIASAYAAPAMFTGAGGDAIFYELLRWWPAADYLRNHGLNAGFFKVAMDAARLGRVSVWHAAALALAEQLRPNLAARRPSGAAGLLAQGMQQAPVDPYRFAHPALRDSDHLPLGKYMQTAGLMHPIGYYEPLEQSAAPEVVHPLLSQPLVELVLCLPTYVLVQGGRGRALARRAFASELPPQILNRRTKGGMEDQLKAVLNANLDLVRSLLLEGQLARRGMLDRPKLEELLSGRPSALVCPMSQIHGLVAVEAWLSRWSG